MRNSSLPINIEQNYNPLPNILISLCSLEQRSLGYLQTHLKENISPTSML